MRRVALPALIVLAGSLAFEMAYGVSLGDALLYIAYELGFVVLPGWLVYLALSHQPGGLCASSPSAGRSATCSRSSPSC